MLSKAATVLVLGDPGPFRKELLVHKEIDVLWASEVVDAKKILATTSVDACIVSPDLHEQIPGLESHLVHVPCIALCSTDERNTRPNFRSVVEVEQVDSLVALLSEHTGLQFARYPRAEVSAPVVVRHGGNTHRLESIDLSLSGIAIARFPAAQIGTRVGLTLELGDAKVTLDARVVRWFEHNGQRTAGLTFVHIEEDDQRVIAAAVKDVLQWAPQQQLSADALFGDLGLDALSPPALCTLDVVTSPTPAFVLRTQDLELPRLCQLLDGEAIEAPDWLTRLAEDLTAVEAAAARDRPCPSWAPRVLRLRIHLAFANSTECIAKTPSALLDEAYRAFEALKFESHGQSGSLIAQIGRIRAALLRSIVVARKRPLPMPRHEVKPEDVLTSSLPAFR